MARRRLPPPGAALPAAAGPPPAEAARAGSPTRLPMARVAGDAAAEAALREVAAELDSLRADGRLVQRLALSAIDEGWLIRDRMAGDPEEMAGLMASIRAHGQRLPVEVADLGTGRYGLISGWRRVQALRALAAEAGGEGAEGHVLALVRAPGAAAEAYVAMVEENEIRAGLSYWERARVVDRACAAGVFATRKQALQQLFANASRARRSKIGSFLDLVQAFDGILRFPAALPERAGLALAQGIARDAGLPARMAQAWAADPPADAAAEQARIAALLARPKPDPEPSPEPPPADLPRRALAPGLWLESTGPGHAVLGGPAVDADFLARLEAWARRGAG